MAKINYLGITAHFLKALSVSGSNWNNICEIETKWDESSATKTQSLFNLKLNADFSHIYC